MNVRCEQFEEILERQDAAELAALDEHARGCEACALQLRLEREISAAAPALQKDWDTPALWARIESRLEQQKGSTVLDFPRGFAAHWRLAAAAVVLMAVTASATWFAVKQGQPVSEPARVVVDDSQRLLNEKALREVEQAEAAYVQSIERLATLAEPKLARPESALLSSYREKLIVLDSAIGELRTQAEGNRFNAHLRKELLEIYQMKQQTLQQLLQEEVR